LHGDPAKPNADVFLKVGGGTVLHNHTHSSAERMILVSGQLRVAYAGTAPATLAPGDYAFGPAGAPHEAKCLSSEPCVLFIAFETAVDAALATRGPPVARARRTGQHPTWLGRCPGYPDTRIARGRRGGSAMTFRSRSTTPPRTP
jgi:hypothetical protein